jgi:hypothetical protein
MPHRGSGCVRELGRSAPQIMNTFNQYEVIAQSERLYLDSSVLVKLSLGEEETPFVNILYLGSLIPIYASFVAFGEYIACLGKKRVQGKIGSQGFLSGARQLRYEFENKLRRAEPPDNKAIFTRRSNALLSKYSNIGGGDLWHLLAVTELSTSKGPVTFVSFDRNLAKAATMEGITAVYAKSLKPEPLIAELKKNGKWIGS